MYCDFYSETRLPLIPDYLKALEKELLLRARPGIPVDTVYLGGGTPSLLTPEQVGRLLQTIRDGFELNPGAEITLEVNPGTIDADYFQELRKTGVNRLSIGVQSFDEDKLRFLSRIHGRVEIFNTLDLAGAAGFENIGLDLIYGVPGETQASWIRDLKQALEVSPAHLSAYMLTIEPLTPLSAQARQGQIIPFDKEVLSQWFKMTSIYLDRAGFDHYEISNFAKGTDTRSRHNSRYWALLPYLGVGAGAHSYDGYIRSSNPASIDGYMSDLMVGRLPQTDQEILTAEQKMIEWIMLRLRTKEGIDLADFQTRFQEPFQILFEAILYRIMDENLGLMQDGCFSLNLDGRTYLNSIVETFASAIL